MKTKTCFRRADVLLVDQRSRENLWYLITMVPHTYLQRIKDLTAAFQGFIYIGWAPGATTHTKPPRITNETKITLP